MFTSYL